MPPVSPSPWLPFGEGSPEARLRVFCLPYAGGGASLFLPWRKRVPPLVDLVPLQLPARETRLGHPGEADLNRLLDSLADVLAGVLAGSAVPYCLFGCSMGAKLSFALCHRLEARGLPLPAALLLAAHKAPHGRPHRPGAGGLPEPEFLDYLRELGGTPETVLTDPDLRRLILPALRADFTLLDQPIPLDPVLPPIVAYAGSQDPAASPAELLAWSAYTRGSFRLRVFPGGHFFFQQDPAFHLAFAEDVGALCPPLPARQLALP